MLAAAARLAAANPKMGVGLNGIDTDFGIDFALLDRPLRNVRRGAITVDEFLDVVASMYLPPASELPSGGEDVVTTASELIRRLRDSAAFDWWTDDPAGQEELALRVLIAVVLNARKIVTGDLQLTRDGIASAVLRRFRDHWGTELCEFIVASLGGLRDKGVGMAAQRGLDVVLPTDLLLEFLTASADPESAESVGATLLRRFIRAGDEERAVTFAATFGGQAHRLLLEAARLLRAESSQWAPVTLLLDERRDAIVADDDCAAVLYAAANAAVCAQPESARTLLAMAPMNDVVPHDHPDRLVQARLEDKARLQIELHALAGVIYHGLGQHGVALRCVRVCARMAAEFAARSTYDDDDSWGLPKAAGWLLASAEPDPAARLVLLKRSYCKYDFRGAIEGRLALLAATAYLELGQPALGAYFLNRATTSANLRLISDHFFNEVRWERVGRLLEVARVGEQELRDAGAVLRVLGYLPEPESGQHFSRIDEQWHRKLWTDDPDLVNPRPKRA